MTKSNLSYSPEIDGLRALAVLSVLLFHLEVAGFSGGFVGVDIFFVISGFLITRLIVHEIDETGKFRFGNFYVRRVRRLFPALFATVLFTFVAALFIFSPFHLERFGGAILYALTSLSNFFFWREAGYFDVSASFKPLLHTWSLSVEEQFYLLWPVSLVFLMTRLKKRGTWIAMAIIGLVSLLLNLAFAGGNVGVLNSSSKTVASWFSDGKATIFYLTPFRIFEFFIGGAFVWLNAHAPKNKRLLDLIFTLGLVLAIAPVFLFTEEIIFPSYNALPPAIGAGLMIFARNAPWAGLIIRNRLAVFIGLTSYSLYLIHWPLIVFFQYAFVQTLSPLSQIAIFALSMGLAVLMYKFIEQPFRKGTANSFWLQIKNTDIKKTELKTSNLIDEGATKPLSGSAFGLVCVLMAILVLVPSANIWANKGWPWRTTELLSLDQFKNLKAARNTDYLKGCWLRRFDSGQAGKNPDGSVKCKVGAKTNILIMGDSHTLDGYNALYGAYGDDPDINLVVVPLDGGTGACIYAVDHGQRKVVHRKNNKNCSINTELLNTMDWSKIDIIVFDAFDTRPRYYRLLFHFLHRHKHLKGILIGSYLGVRPNFCYDLANRFRSFSICRSEKFVTHFYPDQFEKSGFTPEQVLYVDKIKILCGEERLLKNCQTLLPNNVPVFMDGDHFSREAAHKIGDEMKRLYAEELKAIGL